MGFNTFYIIKNPKKFAVQANLLINKQQQTCLIALNPG